VPKKGTKQGREAGEGSNIVIQGQKKRKTRLESALSENLKKGEGSGCQVVQQ
jgi:hypothetical protein